MGNGPTKEKKGKGSTVKGGSSSSHNPANTNSNSNNINNSNSNTTPNKAPSSSSITPSSNTSSSNTTSSNTSSTSLSTTSQPASHHHHHHHHHEASSKDTHKDNHKHQVSSSESSKVEDSKGFSLKKAEELFDKYKDSTDEQQIGPDGIEQLCKDINVDPEDVLVLVLAYHLQAQKMGFFSRDEFITGLQKLGADSLSKLKGLMGQQFPAQLSDAVRFKDIYRFAFSFAKEKETKIIDLQTADALLALVLEPLRAYLQEQTTYKSVNLDQWMNILEFSRSIKADLSNYDENSAWPVLLDEYCEWAKKRLDKAPS